MKLSKTELVVGAAIAIGVFLIVTSAAKAEPDFSACPKDTTCKVVLLTPDQERSLLQMVEATCLSAPYAQMVDVVKFYREMLAKAPSGKAPETKPTREK